jgi:hypothetical protein
MEAAGSSVQTHDAVPPEDSDLAGFSFGIAFNPEGGGKIFFRNFG